MSKKFTSSFLNNLHYSNKVTIIRDSTTTGLAVRLGKLSKTLEFYYRKNGKLKRVNLGRYPAISLNEAKQKIIEFRLLIDKNLPLSHEDKSDKTLESVYKEWSKVKSKTVKDSYRHIDGLMRNHVLPELGEYKISNLMVSDLLSPIHKRIQQGKEGVAAIIFSRLKELLTYAVIMGHISVNPLHAITLKSLGLKRKSREYVIPLDDLRVIYQCNINSLVIPILKLMTLTFLRNNEIRLLKWEYIDYESRRINLPKEVMKTKKSFDVYLTDTMIDILKERELLREPHIDYVFFSRYNNKPLPSTFVPQKYKDVIRATGVDGWKGHDLRRNVTHLVENCNIDITIADALLSHAPLNGVAAIYQRSQLWDQRKFAIIQWNKFLKSIDIIKSL